MYSSKTSQFTYYKTYAIIIIVAILSQILQNVVFSHSLLPYNNEHNMRGRGVGDGESMMSRWNKIYLSIKMTDVIIVS